MYLASLKSALKLKLTWDETNDILPKWGIRPRPYITYNLRDFKCKEVLEALKTVKEAGIRHQIRAGYHVIEPDPQEVENKKKQGYKIIAVSTDMLFFLKGLKLAFKNN